MDRLRGVSRHIQEVWIVVFGERKQGRGAIKALLGLLVLAVAATWYSSDPSHPDPAEMRAQVAPLPAASTAGVAGPTARAGWRKATPITRGQDLGFRFRPDERAPTQGEVIAPGGGQAEPREQANFRPVEPRRKPTYEELQAREQATEPLPRLPSTPYPTLPPPLPPPFPVAPW